MPQLDAFSHDYLRTALSIDRHFPGYVDAYYGPADIKAAVDAADPPPIGELRALVSQLQTSVPSDDPSRTRYLHAALRAMNCSLDMIAGESVDYLDEVARIYDIAPALVDENVFAEAHRALDAALPPGARGETLSERLEQHRRLFEIETADALPLLELARAETRALTATYIDLPDDESVEVTLTSGQPWGAYNWYLGNGRSLIEFNTDIPLSAAALLGTFAHEGYPGHHTEAILKETALYPERGYVEQSVMILHSPSAVIAEGIATMALEMIMPDGRDHDWNRDVLFPAAHLSDEALERAAQLPAINRALKQSRRVTGNAAILFHTGQLTREQAIDYIQSFGLVTPHRAEKSFSFLSHPLYRSYIFTYTEGYDLIDRQPDKESVFRRLLTEQILPSDLATGETHE